MSHRRRSDLPPSRTTDRTPNPRSCRGGGGDRREKMSSWSSRGIASAVFSSKRRVWDNGRCRLPSEPSIRCWFRPTSTRTSTGSHSRSPNASFSGIISSLSPSQEQLCTSIPFDSNIDIRYGHLTWEWKKGIRSYLHPLPFALLYKIMAFLRLDTPWFMVKVPRLLQSFFATFGDLYLYKLSKLVFDEHVARWALFCQLANWFMFFCITRTLSNSLETVLTVIGIFLWLSAGGSSKGSAAASRKGLLVAALACAIRPTSAITWLYVGLLDLIGLHSRFEFLFFEVIPIGVLVVAVALLFDRWMYGSWIFVPLNFLKFNFLSSGGDYYGTHKWHWYFTQGFSVMLLTFLSFSVVGIFKSKEWRLSGLIAWVIGVFSMLGHKEFGFVLPVLPIGLMFSGYSLEIMSKPDLSDPKRRSKFCNRCPSRVHLAVLFLNLSNVPMALYTSLIHQ